MAGSKSTIIIDDFGAGIIDDATLPASNAFQNVQELNIHDNPGRLQLEFQPTAETEAAATDDIDQLIRWFTAYTQAAGTLRLLGLGATGDMYVRTGTTWTRRNTDSNTGQGQGMATFGTRVYWASNTQLGQINGDPETGGNYNNSYLTTISASYASGATQTHRPMKEFLGNLYIGDGRYLFELEGDYTTFDNDSLILPLNYTVTALEVWNDRLVIGTQFGDGSLNTSFGARTFFWDGVSSAADLIVDADTEGVNAIKNLNNQLYMSGGRNGNIYLFDGNEWVLVRKLPDVSGSNLIRPSMMAQMDDSLFIAVDNIGVYRLGRRDSTVPYSLALAYRPSLDETGSEIGAITNFGNQIYFSWNDTSASTLGVDAISTTNYESGGILESQIYEIEDKGNDRLIKAIEVIPHTFTSDHSITVDYRLDNAAVYTNLGTLTSTNINQPLYGIYDRGKLFQLRLTLSTTLATSTPVISKVLVY